MISHRFFSKVTIVVMAIAVALCFLAMGSSDILSKMLGGTGVHMEYESKLFDTDEIISIDIRMDADEWNKMLKNATSEEYYVCDAVVNGKTFKSVAIRPKGNTSLSAIAMDPDSDRFSLKLEFDHFVDGQTCFGLDKLILNNNYADATNMKEAVIYDMYKYIGADASLYNYASVSLNGEYWGVYLALEGVEESFFLRNYGTQDGELYKPDSMEMGGGGGGGFGKGRGGADLNYTDDDLDSYSTIWDGEIFGSGTNDHRRVVTALKNISEGNDLSEYLDVDNILKYMAVHTFAVNMDSLSGSMAHNYYLYEYDGKLNLFPWDYNLSFGGMSMGGSGNATEMVNDAIDTPFSGTKFFDALLENEEYKEIYHSYLRKLVNEYVGGGIFDETYSRIRKQIDPLVETDPTAFYSYDEYLTAADMLYQTVKLRAESIGKQLDGTIPSTDSEQREAVASFVDASAINVASMGQFSMGGGAGTGPSKEGSDEENSSEKRSPSDRPGGADQKNMPEGFDKGNMPEGFDPGNMPDMSNINIENLPNMNNNPFGISNDDRENTSSDNSGNGESGSESRGSRRNMPSFSGMPGGQSFSQSSTSNLILYGICLGIAIVALIVISKWKRHR